MYTVTMKNGDQIAFSRVTTARLNNGIPAYNLANGRTMQYNPNKYWTDTTTGLLWSAVVNAYTGEVYGFAPKATNMPAMIAVNSKYREV